MISVLPVGDPGKRMEVPENTFTETSFPARVAAPTSTSGFTGSPMSGSSEDLEVKRTRPELF
jgi:hypothetical protein